MGGRRSTAQSVTPGAHESKKKVFTSRRAKMAAGKCQNRRINEDGSTAAATNAIAAMIWKSTSV